MIRKLFIMAVAILGAYAVSGQSTFDVPDVYYEWNIIKDYNISRQGELITWQKDKLKGDGWLHIYQPEARYDSIPRASRAKLSPKSDFVAFKISTAYDSLRQLELNDVSKKKYPKDSLGIYLTSSGALIKHERVKSFKVPKEHQNWIAWLHEKPQAVKKEEADSNQVDSLAADSAVTEPVKGQELVIFHPASNFEVRFEEVDMYEFSRNGKLLIFIQKFENEDEKDSIRIHTFNTETREHKVLKEAKGEVKQLAASRDGNSHAFVFTADTTEIKDYCLFLNNKKIADSTASFLKPNWQVSANTNLYFSRNGERLFFETAVIPEPEAEDTLTKDETYHVDVWHWQDKRLQPQQKLHRKNDLKKDYKAFYSLKDKAFMQLEDPIMERVHVLKDNTANQAYGFVSKPYLRQISWTGKRYRDVYFINLKTGEKELILQKHGNRISYSPGGRYIAWYNEMDSCWYATDIKKDKTINLSKNLNVPFYDIYHDTPNQAYAFRVAGWDKDDHVYIHDRYDIWKFDATGKKEPLNITNGYGRKNRQRLLFMKTEPEAFYIPKTMFLHLFDTKNKDAGYARCSSDEAANPEILMKEAVKNYGFKKAEDSDEIIIRKGNFRNYPELWLSNTSFSNLKKISNTNPQQSKYKWGTVELTNWTSANGDSLSGLLYKPENFDPNKKYPMIVYFYERYSNQLHAHYIPRPSHSVINFTRYLNDDYIIFIPDIPYKEGYPGQSAEDAVLSGTIHMIDKGFIDKERIGIQGQSWGGYQVAHLVTRTNMFAAAMAGAPVSNMTSAYGGIRWGSGMSRAFQYERTQSRLGASLWEKPMLYLENSPIFFVPDVNTPVLIMHNDQDGAVPWYQGIEFFNALRRNNKVAYMLVYNNDKHNLRHWGNRIDLSIRMKQFFDHHLKEAPMPVWMKEGLPAVDKGKKTGYQLTD